MVLLWGTVNTNARVAMGLAVVHCVLEEVKNDIRTALHMTALIAMEQAHAKYAVAEVILISNIHI